MSCSQYKTKIFNIQLAYKVQNAIYIRDMYSVIWQIAKKILHSKSMVFFDNKKWRNSKTLFWKKLKFGRRSFLIKIYLLYHFQAKQYPTL